MLARWETKRKKHWLELYRDQWGYSYKTNNGGGFMGNITQSEALDRCLQIVQQLKTDGFNLIRCKDAVEVG